MMESPAQPVPEEIISLQRLLLAQIRKSHRLFVIRFWIMLFFSIFAFGLIAILFFLEDDNSLPTFFMFEVVPIIILVRSLVENWKFLKWSTPYLREIEESGKTSTIMTGLTAYVNRLYQAAFLDTTLGRERPNLSPAQFLREITRRNRLKFVIIGLVIFLVGITFYFFFLSRGIDWQSVFIQGAPILTTLVIVFLIVVAMLIFQVIWMRSLRRWAKMFEELDEWGRQLERVFFKASLEGKGGADN